jgi:putative zinc finger/helix-turn-helix YgiT family protein
MICFKCHGENFATQTTVVRQNFRGEQLDVSTPVSVCKACGWQTLGRSQADDLRKHTADAYREKHGLLTSMMIKLIRKLKSQNQAAFAAYLGVGEASVKRWEAGLVQEKGNDELMRLKCGKELDQIQTRQQWKSDLTKAGWISISYSSFHLVSFGVGPSKHQQPAMDRFAINTTPTQTEFWEHRVVIDYTTCTAVNENLALAA